MADTIDNQEAITPDPQEAYKAELAQAMALQFGQKPPEVITGETETTTDGTETTTNTVIKPPAFTFDTFKDKFGYQAPEDIEKEITELRALKAAPPVVHEYEFENEDSKKLFEAIQKGDRKSVYKILEKQNRIEELVSVDVTKENAADIVKYGMSLKYQNLSPSEIEYKFKKQFSVPPKPVQLAEEEEDEYKSRVAGWQEIVDDKQMELMIEAKTARPEIEAAKTKLVLPEIEQQVDEDYINYKKAIDEEKKISVEALAAYKAFTPESIGTKVNFNDEANKIALEFGYIPDSTSFSQAVEMTTDINKFYDLFKNQDGTPDRKKFLKFIHDGMNHDKMLVEAMKESRNATIKSMLPDNSSGGLIRHLAQSPAELSELDKQMQANGIRKVN